MVVRDRENCLKKERFLECFLGNLFFWVSGVKLPLFFFNTKKKRKRKNKYMTELFSSLIE